MSYLINSISEAIAVENKFIGVTYTLSSDKCLIVLRGYTAFFHSLTLENGAKAKIWGALMLEELNFQDSGELTLYDGAEIYFIDDIL